MTELSAIITAAKAGHRVAALAAMQRMDPQGIWTDHVSAAEGMEPVALEDVIETVQEWTERS